MKLSLRLILFLVISITLVTVILARIQVTAEKRDLLERLAQRAKILTQSLQEAVEPVVQHNALSQLRRIVERFGSREHLDGIAVYSSEGKVLAASQSLARIATTLADSFLKTRIADEGAGEFITANNASMYVYAVPLHRDAALVGILATFHDAFQICPWRHDLLDGLLGADVVAFHIQAHCNNFLDTVDHSIECRIEWDRFTVNRNNHVTMVRPHPISVVFPEEKQETHDASGYLRNRGKILPTLGAETIFLGVGVDRVDYTKGLLERFRGIERFLDKYPHYTRRFTFVQFGAPSRTHIPRDKDLLAEVHMEAQRINDRFQNDRWKPIVFHGEHHSHCDIEPYYKAADLCLVTSLHDGMNLVAKEFVAARDDEDGVLILSQFTGACHELRDALLLNPYDIEQIAEMIRSALEMPQEERNQRMRQMRRIVKEHNVYRWAADLIAEIANVRLSSQELTETK